MSRILSKEFRYVPAAQTDIGKTFKRIRAEQKKNAAEVQTKVKPLVKAKVAA